MGLPSWNLYVPDIVNGHGRAQRWYATYSCSTEVQLRPEALLAGAAVLAQFRAMIANADVLQHDGICAKDGCLFRSEPGRTRAADWKADATQQLIGYRVAGPRRYLSVISIIIGENAMVEAPVKQVQDRRQAKDMGHFPIDGGLPPVRPHDVQAHAIRV
jgi:hypothetical protein